MMRTEAGRDPYDKALTDLVGELCTRSDDFRTRWAAHDVRLHRTGIKQFHHPVVGDLDLNFETMQLTADPGLSMTLLSASAGLSRRRRPAPAGQLGCIRDDSKAPLGQSHTPVQTISATGQQCAQ